MLWPEDTPIRGRTQAPVNCAQGSAPRPAGPASLAARRGFPHVRRAFRPYARDAASGMAPSRTWAPSEEFTLPPPPDARLLLASRGRRVASKPHAVCGETPSAHAPAGATLARCQPMTGRSHAASAMTALACTNRSTSSTARGSPSPRTLPSCTRSRTGIARACCIRPAPRTPASRHPAERSPRCPLPIVRQVVRPVRSDDAGSASDRAATRVDDETSK